MVSNQGNQRVTVGIQRSFGSNFIRRYKCEQGRNFQARGGGFSDGCACDRRHAGERAGCLCRLGDCTGQLDT